MANAYRAADAQADLFGAASGVRREEALPVWLGEAWGKAETRVFCDHLKRGDLSDACEVLGALGDDGARAVLCEAGFRPTTIGDRQVMLESVQHGLIHAARGRMTGHELQAHERAAVQAVGGERSFPGSVAAPSFSRAMGMLQSVLSAPEVEVGVAGTAPLGSRASLQFIGAQAIERNISGFAIEGVQGKFALPNSVSLRDLRSLYGAAGAEMALLEARSTFAAWASGKPAARLSEMVTETAAKVLRGPMSVVGAEGLRAALTDGTIAEYGGAMGVKIAGQVLAGQGVRIDAPPVEDEIAKNGLRLVAPDTKRGQYVGPVVLQDHRASVIKSGRDGALVLRHKDVPDSVGKPELGDTVVLRFKADQMAVSVGRKEMRQGVGR